ncbi:nucleoid-associated protein [Salinarchaeum sp. Harcht-Bsk1]|uniref:nucleoid-associated protein n=1 Tax=Salinarchaeum sp. Harcht-Bsk1 TaxID=1333523 RepID=UPI001651A973|nr:nucleoid-associated protein [Salinarchaeum sp. Harcht-Bsk1]
MTYSPVSPSLDNANQWKESVGGDIDEDLELFERYIEQVVVKADISDVTRGDFVTSDTEAEEWLETARTTDFNSSPDEFEAAGKALAEELNSQIHPRANDGVLFIIQATVEGEPLLDNEEHEIVSVLKLDLVEEERLRLADDRGIEELDLEDIFPEPNELQKGLIYPIVQAEGYRLPGDVKFYQSGSVSDYFHEFLQCEVEEGSLEQAKNVFEVVSELKKEHTGQSADGADTSRFRELKEQSDSGIVGIDEVTAVASDIVGRQVTREELGDRLGVENPDALAIDTENLPSTVKYEVDKEIRVKFPSTAEDRVEKEESEDDVRVTIRGTELDTEVLDS